MTIDDLVKVYDDAYSKAYDVLAYDVNDEDEASKRAGIAAVVRAVRDEMSNNWIDCSHCDQNTKLLNEILGDAGNETVAGGSTREDGQSCNSSDGSSPATDPAPAVCVWTYKPDEVAMPPTSCVEAISVSLGGKWVCTGCLQPIKFTEAK